MWFSYFDPEYAAFIETQEFLEKVGRNISPQGAALVEEFISTAGGGFIDIVNWTRNATKPGGRGHAYIDGLIEQIDKTDLLPADFGVVETESAYLVIHRVISSEEAGIARDAPDILASCANDMARINAFRKFVNTDRYVEGWEHGELFREHFERFAKKLDCVDYLWAYVGGEGEDPGQFTNPQGTTRLMTGTIVHKDFLIVMGVKRP